MYLVVYMYCNWHFIKRPGRHNYLGSGYTRNLRDSPLGGVVTQSEAMAFERVFTRVLKRLPEDDAIALAPQKDKVIQLLHKELLAEGLLAVKEGGGASASSTVRPGVVAAPQNDLSVSTGNEGLTGGTINHFQ